MTTSVVGIYIISLMDIEEAEQVLTSLTLGINSVKPTRIHTLRPQILLQRLKVKLLRVKLPTLRARNTSAKMNSLRMFRTTVQKTGSLTTTMTEYKVRTSSLRRITKSLQQLRRLERNQGRADSRTSLRIVPRTEDQILRKRKTRSYQRRMKNLKASITRMTTR
jgi:hypothetical protein